MAHRYTVGYLFHYEQMEFLEVYIADDVDKEANKKTPSMSSSSILERLKRLQNICDEHFLPDIYEEISEIITLWEEAEEYENEQ